MSEVVIEMRDVSKYYRLYRSPRDRLREALNPFGRTYHKDFVALTGIGMDIYRGEVLGIVGNNGSGKSTLLKIVSSVVPSTFGAVHISGDVVALLELGAGFNPEMTGRENAYFYARIQGIPNNEIYEAVNEAISFADIGEYIDQPLKTYSSGMKSRIAFAISTAIQPEILILDEVLAVGDAPFRAKCYRRIQRLVEGKTTVLFVSHDLNSVRQLCKRVLYLQKGRIRFLGETEEACRLYERDCRQSLQMERESSMDAPIDNTALSCRSVEQLYCSPNMQRIQEMERQGVGDLRIVDLFLTDCKGDVTVAVSPKENYQIRVRVRSSLAQTIVLHMAVEVKTLQGTRVLHFTDPAMDAPVELSPSQVITLSMILDFPLTEGNYYLSVGLFSYPKGKKFEAGRFQFFNGRVEDILEEALFISVGQFPSFPLRGPVSFHRQIKIE